MLCTRSGRSPGAAMAAGAMTAEAHSEATAAIVARRQRKWSMWRTSLSVVVERHCPQRLVGRVGPYACGWGRTIGRASSFRCIVQGGAAAVSGRRGARSRAVRPAASDSPPRADGSERRPALRKPRYARLRQHDWSKSVAMRRKVTTDGSRRGRTPERRPLPDPPSMSCPNPAPRRQTRLRAELRRHEAGVSDKGRPTTRRDHTRSRRGRSGRNAHPIGRAST